MLLSGGCQLAGWIEWPGQGPLEKYRLTAR
jgi:hypothetical protein